MNPTYKALFSTFCSAQFLVESLKNGDNFPSLENAGLCWLLSDHDYIPTIHDTMGWIGYDDAYVSNPGKWDDARMNLLALLAVCEPEDFV